VFGPSHLPSLLRDDYVTNSNDSYWLSNPEHPLEGFSRVIGDERTERTLRTRLGLRIVQQRLDGSDGLPGKGFTLRQLRNAVFNDRQYAGELLRDPLVAQCRAQPLMVGTSGPVDVSAACDVLAKWDLHDNLDSRGALLFRRFASRALVNPVSSALPAVPSPFTTPFSAMDPVNTPNGLNVLLPTVQAALADAVTDLKNANIPLDAPLGDFQYEKRGDEKIPIHGGPGTLGDFNAINVSWDPKLGYPNVPHGSSYVQAVELRPGACPKVRTILTYSQSTNPQSPWFADQTRMFSQKRWVKTVYCPRQVRRAHVVSKKTYR
jgi:acyl-homoserine-lactone acylase